MRFERPTGLMFHHFHGGGHPVAQGSISAAEFGDLLDFIQTGHEILNAKAWLERAQQRTLTPHEVCITFDDALACQYDIALPVLRDRGLTAFWFVYTSILSGGVEPLEIYRLFRTTGFPDISAFYEAFFSRAADEFAGAYQSAQAVFDASDYLKQASFYTREDRWFRFLRDQVLRDADYQRLMEGLMEEAAFSVEEAARHLWLTPAQVNELDADGHIIGLHSHTHPTTMAKLPVAHQRREYEANAAGLERLLGHKVDTVSHPCNSYGPETLGILKGLGVKVGFRANIVAVESRSMLEFDREDHANIMKEMTAASGAKIASEAG